jgi:hypothetical protein
MVVHDAYKLAVDYTLRPTHFYHLGEDPYELHNLATVPASDRNRDRMLEILRRWMSLTSDRILYTPPAQ